MDKMKSVVAGSRSMVSVINSKDHYYYYYYYYYGLPALRADYSEAQ